MIAVPKPAPRDTAAACRVRAAQDRAVYAAVNLRDGLRCRACGTYAGLDAHRHHLAGRRATTVETVVIVCPDCHHRLHVRVGGKTLILTGNADQRNRFGVLDGLSVRVRRPDGTWSQEQR